MEERCPDLAGADRGTRRGRPGLPGSDEPGLGNKTVRIYAVRTPLSRYLFEGSDCVVDCLTAPDREVEDRVRVAIKAMTGKLELVRRQEILFRVPFDDVEGARSRGWRGSIAWRSRSDSREAGSRMGVDAIAESGGVQGPFIDVIVLGGPVNAWTIDALRRRHDVAVRAGRPDSSGR